MNPKCKFEDRISIFTPVELTERGRASSFRLVLLVAIVGACALNIIMSPLVAQEKLSADSSANQEKSLNAAVGEVEEKASAAEIAKLISDLGDAKFATRENATLQLRQIGIPAMDALQVAMNDPDREVKDRAARLLEAIREGEFERQLKEFLVDPDPSQSHGLPAWKYFSNIAGASRVTKQLFVEFQRSQASLARAIDAGGEKMAFAGAAAAEAIQSDLYIRHIDPDLGDTIGLMLIAGGELEVSDLVHGVIRSNTYKAAYNVAMREGGRSKAIRKITGRWLLKTPKDLTLDALRISLEYDVPEGVEIARRVLKAGSNDESLIRDAILALAKLGTVADVPLIEKYLDDDTQIAETQIVRQETAAAPEDQTKVPLKDPQPPLPNRPAGAPRLLPPAPGQMAPMAPDLNGNLPGDGGEMVQCVTQVGDLALAAIIYLNGEPVSDYFPNVRMHPIVFFDVRSLGFPFDSPDERQQVLKRWQARTPSPSRSNL